MGVITYKCPNCGGGLTFNAEKQKYKCEYCLSEFSQEELDEIEKRELEKARKQAEVQRDPEPEGAGSEAGTEEHVSGSKKTVTPIMYTCPSCGAQIVTDETTAASFCYYCHNPIVLEEKLRGEFKPDYVVPFQIDKKKAQEIFTQWVGRKKFVPDYFFSASQIESMTGVYFPYWLYSCQVKGDLQAECVVVGEDFRFGYERRGTPELLQKFGEKYEYETVVISKEMEGNRKVSSTYIREELKKGNMEKIQDLLG